jgi:hypothetical protein
MKTAEDLLKKLGIVNCTQRHLQIIDDFIVSGETDCKKLFDKLGEWDANDLTITKNWLKNLN